MFHAVVKSRSCKLSVCIQLEILYPVISHRDSNVSPLVSLVAVHPPSRGPGAIDEFPFFSGEYAGVQLAVIKCLECDDDT